MRTLEHRFVEHAPEQLEEGVLYVSIPFETVLHKCCCGCGKEVVTPLSPAAWRLTFNGETISLYPSIGNWNFECQSHYWIENNQVIWDTHFTKKQIKLVRKQDLKDNQYFHDKKRPTLKRAALIMWIKSLFS